MTWKGLVLTDSRAYSFVHIFFAAPGGWGGGYREPPKRKIWFILVDHSLSNHHDTLKSQHLSLILLPGMISVQYLPSSHIQIKVVCTVRSVKLVTFVILAAGMATLPHILRAVLPKTPGGGFEGPAHQPCSWGSFEGGRVCLQDLGFVSFSL